MPWNEVTIMSQKRNFIKRVLARDTHINALCDEFNISRQTGYKWIARYKSKGPKGLEQLSRAPLNCSHKTSKVIEDKILATRIQFPTWGARKILHYLFKNGVKQLPSPSTISAILKRNGYISKEESFKRQALGRFERDAPNDLWQMDFKGKFKMQTKEYCFPLTVLDDHSRFSICLRSCLNEQHVTVLNQLILTFKRYGLPKQINVDNGSPWGNSKCLKHTKLTVWLMQLGVKVTHSRPRHPQTNGKDERFHRTLKQDVIKRYEIKNLEHSQKLFDEWREIYNYKRPHEALGMKTPADRYQPSKIVLPDKMPTIEYDEGTIVRKVRGNGRISFANREYLVGEAFEGQPIAIRADELGGSFNLYFGAYKIYTYAWDGC